LPLAPEGGCDLGRDTGSRRSDRSALHHRIAKLDVVRPLEEAREKMPHPAPPTTS